MAKLKVAIIGGGQVAETAHIPAYQKRKEIELVAVMSNDRQNASKFAQRNQIPNVYISSDEMFKKERPDMVSICTPNKYHFQYVIEALENGCHVFCEKPPSISAKEAKQMYECAQKNERILAYNFQHRFSDEALTLRQSFSDRILGDVYHTKVSALRRSGVPGWGNFINKEMQGGGPLIDIGIHMLDSALFILGFPEVSKVTAKMFQKIGPYKSEGTFGKWDSSKYEVEDSLFGFIELKDGGLIQIETSFALQMKPKSVMNIQFFGDQAGATLYPVEIFTDDKGSLVSLYKQEESKEINTSERSIHSFVNHCLGDHSETIATGLQGYQIQKLIESLYISAETGESVYL